MRTKYVEHDVVQAIEYNMPFLTAGVWRLCCETGVRVSDAVKARRKDFDEGGHFNYVACKTGKKGIAAVSSDFLRRYIGNPLVLPNAYAFPSPKCVGKHVTRQTVWNHVKEACIKCGLDPEGVAPHSARKFFAVSLFHEKGIGATMNALQHRDAGTTMIYAMSDDALHRCIVELKQLRKIVDKLCERVFGSDRLMITKSGKKYLESKKTDSEK